MPTYCVTTAVERLSAAERHEIAAAITRLHSEVTGAPAFFAQVIFTEVAPGDHFIGGLLASADAVFIHGQLRAGRSSAQKRDLLMRIVDAVGAATRIPKRFIWAYISELPPTQMVEYGHLLPEPGKEDVWLESLPAAERAHIEKAGK